MNSEEYYNQRAEQRRNKPVTISVWMEEANDAADGGDDVETAADVGGTKHTIESHNNNTHRQSDTDSDSNSDSSSSVSSTDSDSDSSSSDSDSDYDRKRRKRRKHKKRSQSQSQTDKKRSRRHRRSKNKKRDKKEADKHSRKKKKSKHKKRKHRRRKYESSSSGSNSASSSLSSSSSDSEAKAETEHNPSNSNDKMMQVSQMESKAEPIKPVTEAAKKKAASTAESEMVWVATNEESSSSADDDDDDGDVGGGGGGGDIGPKQVDDISSKLDRRDYGGAMLPGEADAIANFVQRGARIPRRGEVGLTSEEIASFETTGFVMSGSRHKRMNAIRIRKENQIYSAEEKRALTMVNFEEKLNREKKLMAQYQKLLNEKKNQYNQ